MEERDGGKHSGIPHGRLETGEGDDDRTFTTFRAPNRNTSPRGKSYQGGEKHPFLLDLFSLLFQRLPDVD